jgi:simple sugar transport system permease protein
LTTTTVTQPGVPQRGAARYVWRLFVEQREVTPFLITAALFAYFAIRSSAFLTSFSLQAVVGYAGPYGALAVGEVLVLVLGEIDLSAGQVFLLSPWVMYWLWSIGIPVGWAMTIGVLCAAMVGLANGVITTRLGVPSFVTTLATDFLLFGFVLVFSSDSEATPIPGALPPTVTSPNKAPFFSQMFGVWSYSEILWVVGLAIIVHFVLTQTRFGAWTIATGGNILGAAESGVPIRRVKVVVFMMCSTIAGLVGCVDAIKYGSLDPGNAGINYILYAVGACVIGGTALTGGRGTVIGALIGALLLGVLQAGLIVIGISTNDFFIWVGVIMILAMTLNMQLDRLVARGRAS